MTYKPLPSYTCPTRKRVLINPSKAIKLFKENDFHLVVTDLKMPGMDGMELCDEFREIKPDVPIIITAYGSPETAHEALKKGVNHFIAKPFGKDSILFTIKKVLELGRVKRQNIQLRRKPEEKKKT